MKIKSGQSDTRYYTLGQYAEKFDHDLISISIEDARRLTQIAVELSGDHNLVVKEKKGTGVRRGRSAKMFEQFIIEMAVKRFRS